MNNWLEGKKRSKSEQLTFTVKGDHKNMCWELYFLTHSLISFEDK